MSLQASPPYNSYHHDSFDFEDDRYDDIEDDRENEDPQADDSDEGLLRDGRDVTEGNFRSVLDTEEASETDMGRNEEPLEIKEQ